MSKPLAINSELIDIKVPLLASGFIGRGNPVRVTVKSLTSHRKAVFKIAQFFRREFHYDFTQYGYKGDEDDKKHVAFLWIHPGAARWGEFRVPCVGATCFRWREWEGFPPTWAMQWIWLHPYFRRTGLLAHQWPEFKKEFGAFVCEPPLSEAMTNFVRKNETYNQQ